MPFSSCGVASARRSVFSCLPFIRVATTAFALFAGLAGEYANAAMPGKIGQEFGPRFSVSEGISRNGNSGKDDGKDNGSIPRSAGEAAASISGTPWPGVIDHLLQSPQPGQPHDASLASIHINYPSLGIKAIDADIRDWVNGIAQAFQSHLDMKTGSEIDVQFEQVVNCLDDPVTPEPEHPAPFELWGSYRVNRPSDAAVSITFELWNYTGAPHGNLDIITLNYSLLTGQRLNFVDLFEKSDLALELMSSWSRKQLEPRLGAARRARMLQDGTEPLVENFASLTLTPGGIRINFQPYQVAPWDAGIQTVDMPLEELAAALPLLALWGK